MIVHRFRPSVSTRESVSVNCFLSQKISHLRSVSLHSPPIATPWQTIIKTSGSTLPMISASLSQQAITITRQGWRRSTADTRSTIGIQIHKLFTNKLVHNRIIIILMLRDSSNISYPRLLMHRMLHIRCSRSRSKYFSLHMQFIIIGPQVQVLSI